MKKLVITVIVLVIIYFVDRNTTIFRIINTCTGLDLPIYKKFEIKIPNYPFHSETYMISLDSLQMSKIILNPKLKNLDSIPISDYIKLFAPYYTKLHNKIDTNFSKISMVQFKENNKEIYYLLYIDYKNKLIWVYWFD
ncbi:MAG: hypothetical protein WBO44_13050 [Saprospiraceae bacterium]